MAGRRALEAERRGAGSADALIEEDRVRASDFLEADGRVEAGGVRLCAVRSDDDLAAGALAGSRDRALAQRPPDAAALRPRIDDELLDLGEHPARVEGVREPDRDEADHPLGLLGHVGLPVRIAQKLAVDDREARRVDRKLRPEVADETKD